MSWVSDQLGNGVASAEAQSFAHALVENLEAGFGCDVSVEFVTDDITLPAGMTTACVLAGIGNSSVEPLPGDITPDYGILR